MQTVVADRYGAEPQFASVCNTPPAYDPICSDFTIARLDPVSQHCKYQSTPISWDQTTYTTVGRGEQWEVQLAMAIAPG